MSTVLLGLRHAMSLRARPTNTLSTVPRSARKIDLPLEMALKILEYADSLNDVIALALTAPVFNAVWIAYKADVLAAVVPRSLECYAEALDLYNTFQRLSDSKDEDTVRRFQRLLAAARIAASVRDHFRKTYHSAQKGRPGYTMTSLELQRFISGFYYLWKVVITACFSDSDEGLPTDPELPAVQEIFSVCEVTIMAHSSDARLGVLLRRAYGIYTPQDHMRYATYQRWRNCCTALWRNDDFHRQRHLLWRALRMRPEPYFSAENSCGKYLEFLCEARRTMFAIVH